MSEKAHDECTGRLPVGELQEDLHLYMRDSGMLMIAPALLDHVTEELLSRCQRSQGMLQNG